MSRHPGDEKIAFVAREWHDQPKHVAMFHEGVPGLLDHLLSSVIRLTNHLNRHAGCRMTIWSLGQRYQTRYSIGKDY